MIFILDLKINLSFMSVSIIIIAITSVVSFIGFNNEKVIDNLIFYPPAVARQKQWYRFVTSGLIHADFGHLIFNMLALFLFGQGINGNGVESAFGEIFGKKGELLYLLMYVGALVICLLPTYNKNKDNYEYRSLGASGAVSAVIFAGLMIAPGIEVYMYFIPIGIPGFVFAPLYLIISAVMEKRGGGNINHSAHIWGALFGVAFIIILGKLIADYNVVSEFLEKTKDYLRFKGYIH
jgi:membrane associated rhomboid family serine protease